MSDYLLRLPWAIMELWLLVPVDTQIQPSRICLFDKRNFPAAAPTLEFLLAGDRVVHIAKMRKRNEAVQMITFRDALGFSGPMLPQSKPNVICDADIQCRAVFVGRNVHPIVVIAACDRS